MDAPAGRNAERKQTREDAAWQDRLPGGPGKVRFTGTERAVDAGAGGRDAGFVEGVRTPVLREEHILEADGGGVPLKTLKTVNLRLFISPR